MLTFVESDKFGVLVVQRDDEYAPIIYADNVKKQATLLKSKTLLAPQPQIRRDTLNLPDDDVLSNNSSSNLSTGGGSTY